MQNITSSHASLLAIGSLSSDRSFPRAKPEGKIENDLVRLRRTDCFFGAEGVSWITNPAQAEMLKSLWISPPDKGGNRYEVAVGGLLRTQTQLLPLKGGVYLFQSHPKNTVIATLA